MSNDTPAAERAMTHLGELDRIEDTYGRDRTTWPAGQRERAERLEAAVKRLALASDDEAAAERTERIRAAIANPAMRESGFAGLPSGRPSPRLDPWRDLDEGIVRSESPAGLVSRAHTVLEVASGLTDGARRSLAESIDAEGGPAAAFVVARSAPAYRSAFEKIVANPERGRFALTPEEGAAFAAVEAVRATLTTNVGTGGYSIPLALDPTLAALTNDGAASPFRAVRSVRQTISSPARALVSAGASGEWLAEGAAAADATPTLGRVDIPLFKLAASMAASYEIFEDTGADLGSVITALVADARDRAEGTAFATGDGTSAPKGPITAVAAVAGSTVTATTRGSFTTASIGDVFAVWNGLPPRARKAPQVSWFANNSVFSIVRQMSPAAQGSSFWAGLADGLPDRLLGALVNEASGVTAATTSGSRNLIAGDPSAYRIVDHISGPQLEYVPWLMDQATGRPNYTQGWMYHQRTGADVLNAGMFRLLLM